MLVKGMVNFFFPFWTRMSEIHFGSNKSQRDGFRGVIICDRADRPNVINPNPEAKTGRPQMTMASFGRNAPPKRIKAPPRPASSVPRKSTKRFSDDFTLLRSNKCSSILASWSARIDGCGWRELIFSASPKKTCQLCFF